MGGKVQGGGGVGGWGANGEWRAVWGPGAGRGWEELRTAEVRAVGAMGGWREVGVTGGRRRCATIGVEAFAPLTWCVGMDADMPRPSLRSDEEGLTTPSGKHARSNRLQPALPRPTRQRRARRLRSRAAQRHSFATTGNGRMTSTDRSLRIVQAPDRRRVRCAGAIDILPSRPLISLRHWRTLPLAVHRDPRLHRPAPAYAR